MPEMDKYILFNFLGCLVTYIAVSSTFLLYFFLYISSLYLLEFTFSCCCFWEGAGGLTFYKKWNQRAEFKLWLNQFFCLHYSHWERHEQTVFPYLIQKTNFQCRQVRHIKYNITKYVIRNKLIVNVFVGVAIIFWDVCSLLNWVPNTVGLVPELW